MPHSSVKEYWLVKDYRMTTRNKDTINDAGVIALQPAFNNFLLRTVKNLSDEKPKLADDLISSKNQERHPPPYCISNDSRKYQATVRFFGAH